jgi:hypothetical protein
LDEARLRVTQEAFEAFLADVDQLSCNRTVPPSCLAVPARFRMLGFS